LKDKNLTGKSSLFSARYNGKEARNEMRNRNTSATAIWTAEQTAQQKAVAPNVAPGKLSTNLLAVYVFILVSRILDLSSIARFRIPLMLFIVLAIATVALLVQRGIQGCLDNKASLCFAALTGWVVMAWPLSIWRANSSPNVRATIEGLCVFVAVVQIASTIENWRKISAALGYAVFLASVLSFHYGHSVQGRLALEAGSLADPNEFALALILGLPFLLHSAATSKPVKKIALYGCFVVVLYCFARTGSRGGLLALAALILVLFVLSKSSQKLLMIVAGLIGIVAAGIFLPTYLKLRFLTFFSANDKVSASIREKLGADVASSEARKELLIQSIQITMQHPLLGVGPGNFPWEARKQRVARGEPGGWALVTHNTYTQYSSECGIPAFIFWVGTLFFCTKYLIQIYRQMSSVDPILAHAARDALSGIAALIVGSCFLALAYGLEIPVLLGLAVSLRNIQATKLTQVQPGDVTPRTVTEQPFSRSRNPLPPRTRRRFDLSGRPRA
jgi:O-antigen ligase